MANIFQIKRGAHGGTTLADGELGLKTGEGKLYIGNDGENVGVVMDTELVAAIAEINSTIAGKAPASHTHTADQVGAVPKTGGAFTGGISAANLSLTDYGIPMEIGKYIDFHNPGSTSDSDGRLMIDGGNLQFNGQTVVHVGNIGGQSVNYANSANYANTAGNANALGGIGAGDFYRSGNKPFVTGSYLGNGGNQFINLGFTPSAVLIGSELRGFGSAYSGRSSGGLAATNVPVLDDSRQLSGHQIVIEITNGGFAVHHNTTPYANDSGDYYNYVAFK